MEIGMTKVVKVQAKTLKMFLKICDSFSASLHDQDGELIFEQDHGYVPDFMPGEHYGDYVILDIDIETGQISNWTPPTKHQIEKWIGG